MNKLIIEDKVFLKFIDDNNKINFICYLPDVSVIYFYKNKETYSLDFTVQGNYYSLSDIKMTDTEKEELIKMWKDTK